MERFLRDVGGEGREGLGQDDGGGYRQDWLKSVPPILLLQDSDLLPECYAGDFRGVGRAVEARGILLRVHIQISPGEGRCSYLMFP